MIKQITPKGRGLVWMFWLALFAISLIRVLSFRYPYSDGDLLRISAVVNSEPVVYETKQYLKLYGLKMYLPLNPEIYYGDKVVLEGLVDDGSLVNVKLISHNSATGLFYNLRKKIISFYNYNLPQPASSLVSGMVLGSKSALPQDFWDDLKRSGTAHVVVASGMNVSLVAGFVLSVLTSFLKRGRATLISIAFVWVYCFMVGFEAPIVRAGIMGSMMLLSQNLGKLYYAGRVLILSALFMIIIKPVWIYDLGFILSFVATLSLMVFTPFFEKRLRFVPKPLNEGLVTSLSAQVGVAPILFATFGNFSLFSPIVNALVLWTVPLITIICGVGGILALIVPLLGKLVLFISYPLIYWFILIISLI